MSSNSIPALAANLSIGSGSAGSSASSSKHVAVSLLDLMIDGFYMLFLLKNRYVPKSAEELRTRVREFLGSVDRGAKRLGSSGRHFTSEDLHLAKYAFCALVDETVLTKQMLLREDWSRRPLQLELFGDQLAGENFFVHLEQLRRDGASRVQAIEVFHMCLLMGFQGKYMMEDGSEKLGYLCDRLGDEIANHKGQRAGFAPHWQAPDRIINQLRSEVPMWVVGAVFALAGLAAFLGMRWTLENQTEADLAPFVDIIKLPPPNARVTITLP